MTDKIQVNSAHTSGKRLYSELSLSLSDQGRAQQYSTSGIEIQKFANRGVASWLKRMTCNGFTYLYCAGVSGGTTPDALSRLQADVIDAPVRPHVLNIWLAGNDIGAISDYDEADTVIAAFKVDMLTIIQRCADSSIDVMISTMPTNGQWVVYPYKQYAHYKIEQWFQELARQSRILAYVNFGGLLAAPKFERTFLAPRLDRSGNIVTVSQIANHGWSVGDKVIVANATHISLDTLGTNDKAIAISTTGNSIVTFPQTGVDLSNQRARVGIVPVVDELVNDEVTHFSNKGASKAALMAYDQFAAIFPKQDLLSDDERDYGNLVGCVKAATQFRANLGMFEGGNGTKTGSLLPTGDVANSWVVEGVNNGGGGNSIVCSTIPHSNPAYSQYTMQRLVITGGNQDQRCWLTMTMKKPIAWVANTLYATPAWVHPIGQTGLFYVSINESDATSGGTQPVWPTRHGETVVDGGVTWECREGFVTGQSELYSGAGCIISGTSSNTAVRSLAWGMWDKDDTSGAGDISDMTDATNTAEAVPYTMEGEIHFCTPEAATSGNNNYVVGMKVVVAAGETVTLDVYRAFVRKTKN